MMVASWLRDLRHLTAIFTVTVQQLESRWPGRVDLCRYIDQDPFFGFGLLVTFLVRSLARLL